MNYGIAYRELVQSHLELIIFLPHGIDGLGRNADSTLVGLPEQVHLLLVLPSGTPDASWPGANELDVVGPDAAGVFVHADILNSKVIRR